MSARGCEAVQVPARAPISMVLAVFLGISTPFAGGCSSPESSFACVGGLDRACAPLYAPTFDQIYTRTLHPTCAAAGSSCHAAAGAQGGLVFEEADTAYALLLGKKDGRARVVPGDPECSLMVERLEADDKAQVMPPGVGLPEAERCAIVRWIYDGAKR